MSSSAMIRCESWFFKSRRSRNFRHDSRQIDLFRSRSHDDTSEHRLCGNYRELSGVSLLSVAMKLSRANCEDGGGRSSALPAMALATLLCVPTALLFVAYMDVAYMDEIFHVPQVCPPLLATS